MKLAVDPGSDWLSHGDILKRMIMRLVRTSSFSFAVLSACEHSRASIPCHLIEYVLAMSQNVSHNV